MFAAGFEDVEGAVDIGGEIEFGCLDGRADARPRREVDDAVELAFRECVLDKIGVANIAFDERDAVVEFRDVESFDFRIIEVVEVIDDGNLVALIEEGF